MTRSDPRSRVRIRLSDGSWCYLDVCDGPIELSDARISFPIRLQATDELELVQAAAAPVYGMFIEERSDSLQFLQYQWNPFVKSSSEAKDISHRGRVAYGLVAATFRLGKGDEFQLQVSLVPSKLSLAHIGSMRRTLLTYAADLLRDRESVAKNRVGPDSVGPMSLDHLQDQLEKYVEPVLGSLSSIARDPRRRPVRPIDTLRALPTATSQTLSIDTIENRFVASVATQWHRALLRCRQSALRDAEHESAVQARLKVEEKAGQGGVGFFVKEHGGREKRFRQRAESAAVLANRVAGALGPLRDLDCHSKFPPLSPTMFRDVRYHAVYQAWASIRAEGLPADFARDSLQNEALASFVYERWALVTLLRVVQELGWRPDQSLQNALLVGLAGETYTIRIPDDAQVRFRRGDAELIVHYEPVMWMKARPRSAQAESLRRRDSLLAALRENPVNHKGISFHRLASDGVKTPDFILTYRGPTGSCSAVVGDAIFSPLARVDFAGLPEDVGVKDKFNKVRDKYAQTSVAVLEHEGLQVAFPVHEELFFVAAPCPESLYYNEGPAFLLPLVPPQDAAEPFSQSHQNAIESMRAALERMEKDALEPVLIR